MPLPITAFFAGILALWTVFLIFRVVGFRRNQQVSLGDGGDEMGQRLIRAHGNAAETIPLFLILSALSEGLGSSGILLIAVSIAFTIGRMMHGIHFMKIRKSITLRFFGMILTLLPISLLSLVLVVQALI